MIFPDLKNKIYQYVNLDTEAMIWAQEKEIIIEKDNILLDPKISQKFLDDIHQKYHIDFSYGGWLEDRSFLLSKSYLNQNKKFIHLGIDINVPGDTKVATNFNAEVVKIEHDDDFDLGWGSFVVLKNLEKDVFIIYAHLDKEVFYNVGDTIKKDTVFAKIGYPPENGNWWTHLHIQVVDSRFYKTIKEWGEIDGYGKKENLEEIKNKFKNPMDYICLN